MCGVVGSVMYGYKKPGPVDGAVRNAVDGTQRRAAQKPYRRRASMLHARRLLLWAAVPITRDQEQQLREQQLIQQLLDSRLVRAYFADSQPQLSEQLMVRELPEQLGTISPVSSRSPARGSRSRRSVSMITPGSGSPYRPLPDLLHACPALSRRQPAAGSGGGVGPGRRPGRKQGRVLRPSLPAPPAVRAAPAGQGHSRKISMSDTLRQVGRDLRRIADHLQIYKLLTRPRAVGVDRDPPWTLPVISGLIGCAIMWGFSAILRRALKQ